MCSLISMYKTSIQSVLKSCLGYWIGNEIQLCIGVLIELNSEGDDATGYYCVEDRDCVHRFSVGTCDLASRRCKGFHFSSLTMSIKVKDLIV